MKNTTNRPTQAQETIMIKDLQRVIQINDLQAREILANTAWNLQKASNIVLDYQNKGTLIEQQFNKYLRKGESVIQDEGIQQFCLDLGIDIMDPIILYISYQFKAEQMGIYTKFDFYYGFINFKCQSTLELRKLLPRMREDLNKLDVLKSVYKFCFDFSKKQRDLDYLVAQGLWDTLLKSQFPSMIKFLEYVDQMPQELRTPISRDTYFMVWEFCVQIGTNLQKYDYLTGAWPIFIDGFYFYMHPEHKPTY